MHEQRWNGKLRRRRTRAEVDQLLAEFETSGLTQREFCQLHHMSLSTFGRYRERQRNDPRSSSAPNCRLMAVEVAEPGQSRCQRNGSGLAIALAAGRRIEIGIGFDAQTLRQLLQALELN